MVHRVHTLKILVEVEKVLELVLIGSVCFRLRVEFGVVALDFVPNSEKTLIC